MGRLEEGVEGGLTNIKGVGKAIWKGNITISFLKIFLKYLYDCLCKICIKLSQPTFQQRQGWDS